VSPFDEACQTMDTLGDLPSARDAMRTGQMHYAHYGSAISDDING
jgi:hypothetical protein